jgi:hypothetical protein
MLKSGKRRRISFGGKPLCQNIRDHFWGKIHSFLKNRYHIEAARNAILLYIHETGKADFVDGKMIFLQGSPVLENTESSLVDYQGL